MIAGADLIVAGAPLLGFSLPTESMVKGLATNPGQGPTPPDLSHPSMRSWIAALPAGDGKAFEKSAPFSAIVPVAETGHPFGADL